MIGEGNQRNHYPEAVHSILDIGDEGEDMALEIDVVGQNFGLHKAHDEEVEKQKLNADGSEQIEYFFVGPGEKDED